MSNIIRLISILALILALGACDDDSTSDDVGADQGDTAVDTGDTSGTDVSGDATEDGGADAATDVLDDGGTDAAADAGDDGGTDAAADAEDDGGTDATADAGPTCRNYMTNGSVSSSAITGTITATFDSTDLELSVSWSSLAFNFAGVRTYASVDDFVDEAATVGRVLSLTWTTTGDLTSIETYSYDVDKRLTGVFVDDQGPADRDQTKTFTEWDSQGRPTVGTMNISAGVDCADIPITIAYDDTARKRTETLTFSGGTGGECASTDTRTNWEIYDADGNTIQQVVGATAGSEDIMTTTVNDTETVCK